MRIGGRGPNAVQDAGFEYDGVAGGGKFIELAEALSQNVLRVLGEEFNGPQRICFLVFQTLGQNRREGERAIFQRRLNDRLRHGSFKHAGQAVC